MPNGLEWKISGLKELDQKLRSLPDNLQKKALRITAGAGGRIIRDQARNDVRHSVTHNLEQAIRVTTRVDLSLGRAIAKVFVSIKKAWYGRLVEGGTKGHPIIAKKAKALKLHGGRFAKSIQHPGSKPYPFMAPAAESKSSAAIDAVIQKLKQALDKFSK